MRLVLKIVVTTWVLTAVPLFAWGYLTMDASPRSWSFVNWSWIVGYLFAPPLLVVVALGLCALWAVLPEDSRR